tara:strand:+ start:3049 stop:3927 length:879 start_codon:yes stop_codon:yes gene_type:complete
MIIEEILSFDYCEDLVSTEETIWGNLEKENLKIKEDYLFMKFPFADLINKNNRNILLINRFLQSLRERYPITKTLVFICQHIDVIRLVMPENCLLFTPHATKGDNYISIPHFTPFDPIAKPIPLSNRPNLFCFHGASCTHETRKKIFNHYKNHPDFNLIDTGAWHFEKSDEARAQMETDYAKSLSECVFSLCPRGTGPSTIRIWDSFALGSIPVIFSDGLEMPISNHVNWEDSCIFVSESSVDSVINMIPPQNVARVMIKNGHEIYNKFFKLNNLHKTIEIYFRSRRSHFLR